MVFTSIIFLFYFLPVVLLSYYIVPKRFRKIRNFVLLIFSLLFYFVGEPRAIIWMFYSIGVNYLIGFLIARTDIEFKRKFLLILAIICNLSVLGYFKYSNFFGENIYRFLGETYEVKDIIMPIGISFYTFQGMSYVIDIYRNVVPYQKNPLGVGLYISLFPQLIAGPIVRYETIASEIDHRDENLDMFFIGISRFIVGVGKKMLLANKFGELANDIYGVNTSGQLPLILAWLGATAYSFQIFFDFSGYSDMAIGLGKIFGFNFEENFNYPYISKSITEFWRRWHISLGTWFRDYVYIPLGGNRVSRFRHILNILIVWILTGFWHGASWNYVIWGLYFGIILILEKNILSQFQDKIPNIVKHIYSLLLIIIGWVIFRNENYIILKNYLSSLFAGYGLGKISDTKIYLEQYLPEFVFAIILSTPLLEKFEKGNDKLISIFSYLIILILSLISLLSSSFNPFIYFRF